MLEGHTNWVNMAIWNQDESRIITASDDNTAKLWDAQSTDGRGKLLTTFDGHSHYVRRVQLNAAGDRLLTASEDGTARVWDIASGQELLQLRHNGPVEDARWNAAEDRILTASDDGTVRLWDAASGAALATFTGHTDIVWQARWNHDESRILTASQDGTARQFYTQAADVIAAACAAAIRNMTADEWAATMQGQPYRATCTNLPE